MKIVSLQNKFVFSIGTLFLIGIAGIIMYLSVNFRSAHICNASEKNQQSAAMLANQVKAEVEIGLDAARTTSQIFATYQSISPNERRKLFDTFLVNLLHENNQFLCAWTVWEPNVLDGMDKRFVVAPGHDSTGRYVPAWYRQGKEILVQPNIDYMVEGLGDYYQIPRKTMKEAIIGPYFYSYTGNKAENQLIVSLCAPIIKNGKFLGVAGIDISARCIQNIAKSSDIISAVFANDGTIAAHFDSLRLGHTMAETEADVVGDSLTSFMANVKAGKSESMICYSNKLGKKIIITSSPIKFGNNNQPWAYSTIVPVKELFAQSDRMFLASIIIGLIACVLMMLLLILLVRSIVKPIKQSIAFAKELSKGNLRVSLDLKKKDEVGELVNALTEMGSRIREVVQVAKTNTQCIVDASLQLSATSQSMSQGASEQASSIEEISASMEQMSSNIMQNAENSLQTEKIANNAASEIMNSNMAVNQTVISMKSIAEKVSIISEIAFQTNILALNAAVEAARAGEHGKGFAVVAAEVRRLAERSQMAAKEINELSKSSLLIAEQTGDLFTEIVPSIKNTARLVQEISISSAEQNNGTIQINNAIQQLNIIAQQSAEASERLAANAEAMSSQTAQLQDVIDFFKVESDDESVLDNERKHDLVKHHPHKQNAKPSSAKHTQTMYAPTSSKQVINDDGWMPS